MLVMSTSTHLPPGYSNQGPFINIAPLSCISFYSTTPSIQHEKMTTQMLVSYSNYVVLHVPPRASDSQIQVDRPGELMEYPGRKLNHRPTSTHQDWWCQPVLLGLPLDQNHMQADGFMPCNSRVWTHRAITP